MKEVKRYKCAYCRALRATIAAMKKHEKQCICNPNSINCYRCAYAYEADVHSYEGYPTGVLGPHCAYTEDHIRENIAGRCEHYEISDQPYHTRRVCPETKEDEAE